MEQMISPLQNLKDEINKSQKAVQSVLRALPHQHTTEILGKWHEEALDFQRQISLFAEAVEQAERVITKKDGFLFSVMALAGKLNALRSSDGRWQRLSEGMVSGLRRWLWQYWQPRLMEEGKVVGPRERVEAGVGALHLQLSDEKSIKQGVVAGFRDWYQELKRSSQRALDTLEIPTFGDVENFARAVDATQKQLENMEKLLGWWFSLEQLRNNLVELEAKEILKEVERSFSLSNLQEQKDSLEKGIEELNRFLARMQSLHSQTYGDIMRRGIREVTIFQGHDNIRKFHKHPLAVALAQDILLWREQRQRHERAYLRVAWFLQVEEFYEKSLKEANPRLPDGSPLGWPLGQGEWWAEWLGQHFTSFIEGLRDDFFYEPALPSGQRWLALPEDRRKWQREMLGDLQRSAQHGGPTEGKYLFYALWLELCNWRKYQNLSFVPLWKDSEWRTFWTEMSLKGGEALLKRVGVALEDIGRVCRAWRLPFAFPGVEGCFEAEQVVSNAQEEQPAAPQEGRSTLLSDFEQIPLYEYEERLGKIEEIVKSLDGRLQELRSKPVPVGNLPFARLLWDKVMQGENSRLERMLAAWRKRYKDIERTYQEAQKVRSQFQQRISEYYERTSGWWGRRRAERVAEELHLCELTRSVRRYWEGSSWWKDVEKANRSLFEQLQIDKREVGVI